MFLIVLIYEDHFNFSSGHSILTFFHIEFGSIAQNQIFFRHHFDEFEQNVPTVQVLHLSMRFCTIENFDFICQQNSTNIEAQRTMILFCRKPTGVIEHNSF